MHVLLSACMICMICIVSGVCFRDGTLAHWVTHSVGASSVPQGRPLRAACAIHPTHPVRLVVQLFCLHCSLVSYFISPVGTTVQIMLGLHRVIDTRQIREYPDSTISKVLTILKWRMITTFNRKLLEKPSCEATFLQCQCYCQFWKSFNPVYISKFFTGQTD